MISGNFDLFSNRDVLSGAVIDATPGPCPTGIHKPTIGETQNGGRS
jgi:hypothetical protein